MEEHRALEPELEQSSHWSRDTCHPPLQGHRTILPGLDLSCPSFSGARRGRYFNVGFSETAFIRYMREKNMLFAFASCHHDARPVRCGIAPTYMQWQSDFRFR